MRRYALLLSMTLIAFSLTACSPTSTETITVTFDFSEGAQGWVAGVSDYSVDQEEIIEFESGIQELPDEIDGDASGFYVSSQNRSDDLFVYLKRRIGAQITSDTQLEPDTTYRLNYTITLASNAQSGCSGVGGAPGESVYLKVGGSVAEPTTLPPDDTGYYALSVDKGIQSNSGPVATVIGDIANGQECDDPSSAPYVTIVREGQHETRVRTDSNGDLWLLVGTDSAFEGLTQLYFQSIVVELSK